MQKLFFRTIIDKKFALYQSFSSLKEIEWLETLFKLSWYFINVSPIKAIAYNEGPSFAKLK